MACHAHLDGKRDRTSINHSPAVLANPDENNSAEVIADMIISEITGLKWIIPDWLPERYLTWSRI